MDIHGISYEVYTWYIRCISMDIPSFLKPDFLCRPVLLVSFNLHTCVGDQECFIPCATMAIVELKRLRQNAHYFFCCVGVVTCCVGVVNVGAPASHAGPIPAAVAAVRGGGGSGDGGGAGFRVFPGGIASYDFFTCH
jgi:hypothetical protein